MSQRILIAYIGVLGLLFCVTSTKCFADAAALFEQAKNYTSGGYGQEAEQIYKRIIEDYPGTGHVLKAQSELIILDIPKKQDSQIQDAIDNLIANYSNHQDLPSVLCNIAMGFGWAGKFQHAKNLYQQVIQQWPDSSTVRKAQLGVSRIDIILLIKAGDYSAAETQIAQILEDFSDLSSMPEVLYHIARRYQWSRKYERAASIHQELIRRYPDSDMADRARLDIARTGILKLIKTGNYAAAETEIAKLLQNFSGHLSLPTVIHSIAREYETKHKYGKAASLHQQIIQQWPDNPYIGMARFDFSKTTVMSLIQSGSFAAATVKLDELVEGFSGDSRLPAALYKIAVTYEQSEKYEQARTIYQQIIQNYPDNPIVLEAQLGVSTIQVVLSIESGDYTVVEAEFDKLVKDFAEHPGLPSSFYEIAGKYEWSGQYERAKSLYQQIIQQYPDSQQIIQQYPDSSYATQAQLHISRVNNLSLSLVEQEGAIALFESQYRRWFAIESGTARYEAKVRSIKAGQFVPDSTPAQTGTLWFVVAPLNSPIKLQSPAKVQVCLTNDKYKWNFVNDNVFDSESPYWQWADDPNIPIEGEMVLSAKRALQPTLLFLPLDLMAKTYPDEQKVWNNKYMTPKYKFFYAGRGVPVRRSTQEETNHKFGGEPQYLYLISPAVDDAHYWFSAENGELRQIDVFIPEEDVIKSFRYENYVRKAGEDASFPQRFILTWKKGSGDSATGLECTVELTGVELNIDIPAERFVPPQADH